MKTKLIIAAIGIFISIILSTFTYKQIDTFPAKVAVYEKLKKDVESNCPENEMIQLDELGGIIKSECVIKRQELIRRENYIEKFKEHNVAYLWLSLMLFLMLSMSLIIDTLDKVNKNE